MMTESDDLVQFKLMLPATLKQRVAAAAQNNRRSLSQEIVAALEEAYPAVGFDYLAMGALVDAYRDAESATDQARILKALQDFLRAFGNNVSVSRDPNDDEIILRGN